MGVLIRSGNDLIGRRRGREKWPAAWPRRAALSLAFATAGCGAAPEQPCAQFDNPQLHSAGGGVVRMAFRLSECGSGAPMANLELSVFELLEDGLQVSSLEGDIALSRDDRNFQQSILLMMDVSGSVMPHLDRVKLAARSMIRALPGRPRLAVYTFDGRPEPQMHLDFTADLDQVTRAVESIPAAVVDPSTNLNGAVVTGLTTLDARGQRIQAEGSLYAGALALFTDGTDRAGRIDDETAENAARDGEAAVFVVGLGSEIDERYLGKLAQRGAVELAADLDQLSDAFQAVGDSIADEAGSHYVVAYCSPSRAGTHELSLTVAGMSGSLTNRFDATGFSAACDPAQVLQDDLTPAR